MLLLIDNYDSFSYNLYQMLGALEPDIRVIRNDAMTVEEIEALQPSAIIISPGPGKPSDSGICEEVIAKLRTKLPILGVCLGHQAICEVYGATVGHAKTLMHGKQSLTTLEAESPLFAGLGTQTKVARYHSLSVEEDTLPETLIVTARADDGEVMAVQDRDYPVYGLQFHPESIMTPEGSRMLENFLAVCRKRQGTGPR